MRQLLVSALAFMADKKPEPQPKPEPPKPEPGPRPTDWPPRC